MGKKTAAESNADTLAVDRGRIAKLEAQVAALAEEVALLRAAVSGSKSVPAPGENFAEYSAAIREAKMTGSHTRLTKYLNAAGKVPRGTR